MFIALGNRPELASQQALVDSATTAIRREKSRMLLPNVVLGGFQTPGQVVMVFEYDRGVRTIYTNGTPHPRGPLNWWMGDSRGRWEENTLVVDVVHFTDQTWLDRAGNFHSDALHLVERYTPAGSDHINYEVTVDDPNVFTRPWTMRKRIRYSAPR